MPVWIDQLTQDTHYAWRQLRRAPGFSGVLILTLALGIGVNTAIFSVVNAVLLKRLAYTDSDRIVRLVMDAPASESPTRRPLRASLGLSAAEIREVRSRARMLSEVGSTGVVLRGLSGKEDAARLRGARVSSTVFKMLDARPIRGRVFHADDEAAGAEPVTVLSYGAWQRFFRGDADVVGRTVTMDSVVGPRSQTRYTVVGVMPSTFSYPDSQTQFWIAFQPTSTGPPVRDPLVARLNPGVSIR